MSRFGIPALTSPNPSLMRRGLDWQKIHNHPALTEKRRTLRRNSTIAEKIIWERLRNRQIDGIRFRRQHSVGGYILDFYCASRRIAIELDGNHHISYEVSLYDAARTKFLNKHNIEIIRFYNSEVINNSEIVIQKIKALL